MTRRGELSKVGGGLKQVLRNAIKSILKRKENAKNAKKSTKKRVKTSARYVTGKGGSSYLLRGVT